MIRNFFCSYILYVLVWTEYHAETANVAEGADGTVAEAGIAEGILQVYRVFGIIN
jgi:hypothetical protein